MFYFASYHITTEEDAKKAYRELVKKYHPDHGGSEEQFKKLVIEYKRVLENLKKKKNLKYEQKEANKEKLNNNFLVKNLIFYYLIIALGPTFFVFFSDVFIDKTFNLQNIYYSFIGLSLTFIFGLLGIFLFKFLLKITVFFVYNGKVFLIRLLNLCGITTQWERVRNFLRLKFPIFARKFIPYICVPFSVLFTVISTWLLHSKTTFSIPDSFLLIVLLLLCLVIVSLGYLYIIGIILNPIFDKIIIPAYEFIYSKIRFLFIIGVVVLEFLLRLLWNILLIIGAITLTVMWLGFIFGSVLGVIIILVFAPQLFLLPMGLLMFIASLEPSSKKLLG